MVVSVALPRTLTSARFTVAQDLARAFIALCGTVDPCDAEALLAGLLRDLPPKQFRDVLELIAIMRA